MDQREEILMRVKRLMDWTDEKTLLWYQTPNPWFGNASPEWMVQMSRGHKVIGFVEDAEEQNALPQLPTQKGPYGD